MPQRVRAAAVTELAKQGTNRAAVECSEVKGSELVVADLKGIPMHRASLNVVNTWICNFASQLLAVNRIRRMSSAWIDFS